MQGVDHCYQKKWHKLGLGYLGGVIVSEELSKMKGGEKRQEEIRRLKYVRFGANWDGWIRLFAFTTS